MACSFLRQKDFNRKGREEERKGRKETSFRSFVLVAALHCSMRISVFAGASDFSNQPEDGVVELVYDSFLQRNNGVVGDADLLGADLGTTLCDVTEPDPQLIFEQTGARDSIKGVHFQTGHSHEESRSAEL